MKLLLPSAVVLPAAAAAAFVVPSQQTSATFGKTTTAATTTTALGAAPARLEENVDGVLYVNDKCINCAACAGFAPDVFARSPSDAAHVVHSQPSPLDAAQVDRSRAALAACPVAAIRVSNSAQMNHANKGDRLSAEDERLAKLLAINTKVNGLELPFPRPLRESEGDDGDSDSNEEGGVEEGGAYYLGHHNEKSFGAVPYLATGTDGNGKLVHVMVDTPKFTPSAVRAVQSLTGDAGLDYLMLTHVDDTADHNKWAERFPNLKRIFHEGDLGRHNWLNDRTLEDVEVLLRGTEVKSGGPLRVWTLDGKEVESMEDAGEFVLLHTPGHSPGSICLLYSPQTPGKGGVLFTGDTYAYSTRDGGRMTGFPRYGNDPDTQITTLRKLGLLADAWDAVAPGHGHPRDYGREATDETRREKIRDVEEAIEGILAHKSRFALR
eukprot:CAMPEP_0197450018 /NCGR_PEP_ID=MMETSP1175-20131217/23679_1 /TAXON_ID=1003142 /ORGANISM="Triceratium dubium, Strain CCMP147" /LENGTH=436 /DNA_ID=CAMNT_0042982325 /DNA_START=144 /DNA_END=1454 /DNA_ORIENTATION=+